MKKPEPTIIKTQTASGIPLTFQVRGMSFREFAALGDDVKPVRKKDQEETYFEDSI